jgi:cell wall-associated NlpC family hydrolase
MGALDPRLNAVRPDLADAALEGRVEAARFATGEPVRIRAASAPLRRHPAPDAPLDTEALMGEGARVFERAEGWAWLQLDADGYVGYAPEEALGPADAAPTHRVAALRTFVYPGPSIKLPPLAALSMGAAPAVATIEGEFAALAGGGFVIARHLVEIAHRAGDFVAEAERLLGAPYLWGGKTSLGLDCSGLVALALRQCGIPAPRDSDHQEAALGAPIAEADALRRGDLVFWRGHVGVMRDASTLLHANGHTMTVAGEPLADAAARILAKGGGPVTARRRLAIS